METEIMNIFDEQRNNIGKTNRADVHQNGLWHETFHCWFVNKEADEDYIYFQIRSGRKKDFPNLLDITAAGHLLATESVEDGVREIEEEIGIDVPFNDLLPVGLIKNCIVTEDFIDREFSHVFLYRTHGKNLEFKLQKSEVSGMVKAKFHDFYDLCLGKKEQIRIEGYEINQFDEKVLISKNIEMLDFVPHQLSYLESIVRLIREQL